jgi:hypothetical protein
MGRQPKWLDNDIAPQTTRARSGKQESRLAKSLKGYTSVNSGATFGQNDIINDYSEVEAKTTAKDSYSLKLSDWEKLVKKCPLTKIPLMVLSFETNKTDLVILSLDEYKYLVSQVNGE